MTSESLPVEPQLPDARGPVSLAVLSLLTERVPHSQLARVEASLADSDPYGIDLQLALYACYELHYRGFAGVDARWEWNAGLLDLRGQLENAFLTAVHQQVGEIGPDENAADEMHGSRSNRSRARDRRITCATRAVGNSFGSGTRAPDRCSTATRTR